MQTMKKVFILIAFVFIGIISQGQGLNVELGFNDAYTQYTQEVLCSGPYSYLTINEGVTGTITFGGIGRSTRLMKIDTLGQKAWDVLLTPKSAEFTEVVQMVPSDDGGVYLLGYAELIYAHPFTPDGYFCFLQKQDPQGNVVWMKDWVVDAYFTRPFTGLTKKPSGDLLLNRSISNESWVFTISSAGVITDSLQIAEPNLQAFSMHSGFALTGYRNDSLMGFNTSGTLIQMTQFSTPVKGICSLNDTLFVLTHDTIHSFNGYLQPIASTAVSGYTNYSTLRVQGQDLRLLSHGSNAITLITINRQLQTMGTLTIPEAITPQASIDFNDLHLSVGITFDLAEFSAVRYLDYSLNSTQNANINRTDIGVVKLLPVAVEVWPAGATPGIYTTRLEASVLIRNYGSNTLQSCRITRYNSQGVAGNPTVFAQAFNSLNLAPGDSMWLQLGAIHQGTFYYSGPAIIHNICIHTNHPNGLIDLNVSNDEYCTDVLFGYVGIAELESDAAFAIYPNPTDGMIHFDLPAGEVEISVYSVHGRLVYQEQTTGRQLDLTGLPAGIYLVRLFHPELQRVFTGKMVVE
jgi:hypothetical protein